MAALVLIGALATNAQSSVFNNPNNKGYWGIRASLDVVCPTSMKSGPISVDAFDTGVGFTVGGVYNLPLVANLYFEPGVSLYYDTYGVKSDALDIPGFKGDLDCSFRKFGVRIPLNFGYHFDFTDNLNVFVYTGPMFEEGIVGKLHVSAKQNGVSASDSESIYGDGGMPRADLLWNFGAGVNFNHFTVGVGGSVGMLNMSGDDDVKFRENLVQLTVGYNF